VTDVTDICSKPDPGPLLIDVIALGGCFNGNLPRKPGAPAIFAAGPGHLRGRSDRISTVTHTARAEID
jgi:hypothetical protein